MNVYIAGPMRGHPNFNFPAFHAAAAHLRTFGYEVFSPAERDETVYGKLNLPTGDEDEFAQVVGAPIMDLRREIFRVDCTWICLYADAIYLLKGWQTSKGARAEKALGEALGLAIWYEEELP